MHALILASAMVGQLVMPSLPRFDPDGYRQSHPAYIWPAGPPVGNPLVLNFGPYTLVGNVESVDRKNHRFILVTPMERLEVRYFRQTLWLNAGHLQPGITVAVDQMSRSVSFLPRMTMAQIAAQIPQFRTGYEDAP